MSLATAQPWQCPTAAPSNQPVPAGPGPAGLQDSSRQWGVPGVPNSHAPVTHSGCGPARSPHVLSGSGVPQPYPAPRRDPPQNRPGVPGGLMSRGDATATPATPGPCHCHPARGDLDGRLAPAPGVNHGAAAGTPGTPCPPVPPTRVGCAVPEPRTPPRPQSPHALCHVPGSVRVQSRGTPRSLASARPGDRSRAPPCPLMAPVDTAGSGRVQRHPGGTINHLN